MLDKIKEYFFHKERITRSNRWIFIVILVTSILSLIASFILTIDAFELAKDPNVHLNCSINAAINCVTVANSEYSALFGFPNSFIALMAEPVLITIAIAYLMGARFPKKIMFGVQLATIFAFVFAFVLFLISSFLIQVLCPWCMLVFISSIVMFFAVSRFNIRENNLYLSNKMHKKMNNFIEKDYDKFTLALLIVLIISFIIIKYGANLLA